MKKCFAWVPEERLKPEDALKHPWITSHNNRSTSGKRIESRKSSLMKTQPYYSTRKGEEKKPPMIKDKFNNTTTLSCETIKNNVVKKKSINERLKAFTTKKTVPVKTNSKRSSIKPKSKANNSGLTIQRYNNEVKQEV